MIDHLGGRDLNLADWVERGYARTIQMGVFVPSEKILERLVRAACRDFREGYLITQLLLGTFPLVLE